MTETNHQVDTVLIENAFESDNYNLQTGESTLIEVSEHFEALEVAGETIGASQAREVIAQRFAAEYEDSFSEITRESHITASVKHLIRNFLSTYEPSTQFELAKNLLGENCPNNQGDANRRLIGILTDETVVKITKTNSTLEQYHDEILTTAGPNPGAFTIKPEKEVFTIKKGKRGNPDKEGTTN